MHPDFHGRWIRLMSHRVGSFPGSPGGIDWVCSRRPSVTGAPLPEETLPIPVSSRNPTRTSSGLYRSPRGAGTAQARLRSYPRLDLRGLRCGWDAWIGERQAGCPYHKDAVVSVSVDPFLLAAS